MLFGKWDVEKVTVDDASLRDVMVVSNKFPHTHAHHANKYMKKIKVNVIERLINKLMRGGTGQKVSGRVIRTHGQLQGKKWKLIKKVEKAFEIIEKKTGENPIQMLVWAIQNAAPREDITKMEIAGVRYQLAVDISSIRRIDVALRNIVLATIMKTFNNKRTLEEALAEEIILAARGDTANSFALRKKDEIERIAKSAR